MNQKSGHSLTSVDEVYRDFKGRRNGLIKALTTDVEKFYEQCDPEKENLCLYGYPNEQWEVSLPAIEVPPEIPEPALGINFARDGMQTKDWLAFVAVHSDSWLLSVAFYFGTRFGFQKADRKRLFSMINDLPTVFDVVTGTFVSETGSNKSKTNSITISKYSATEEDEYEHRGTLCGACGENYTPDEFWIGCDTCLRWFHGKCVKITLDKADHINHYNCPTCSPPKARP